MINKKLIHFKTKQNFEDNLNNIPDTSIVFILNTQEISTHDTIYSFVNWSILDYSIYVTEDDTLVVEGPDMFTVIDEVLILDNGRVESDKLYL